MNKLTGNKKYDTALFTILILLGVIVVQNFPQLPQNTITVVSIPKENERVIALQEEVRVRTLEIYKENFVQNMRQANTQALMEKQIELQKLAKLVPEEDYADLKQALVAMGNVE